MFVAMNELGSRPSARSAPAFPAYGRFLQTDPIGYEDNPNLYAYVLNDPVNLTDPTGRDIGCQSRISHNCMSGDGAGRTFGSGGSSASGGGSGGSGGGGGRVGGSVSADTNGDGKVDGADEIIITGSRMSNGFIIKREWSTAGASFQGAGGARFIRASQVQEPKAQCIAPSDGPVYIKGGTFTMALILGGSFTVGKFEIPSIGASGWFSSGSANLGLDGFVGGTVGVVDTFGNFVGKGASASFNVHGPLGGSFGFSGGKLSSALGSFGAGGGGSVSYGGTNIKSSNIPPC